MSSKADPKLNNAAGEEKAEEEEEITFKSLGVSPTLCEACDALGWKYPTKIQAEALPLALQGRDIIGLAETGSGKTAAFAIPVIQDLLEKPRRLFAVVLAPTRELAFQINEQFEALGAAIGLKCAVIVGGVDMMTQAVALGRRPHVVIATPGRLVDHLENTKGFNLKTVKYFILDEADRMLSMDFEDAINTVLEVCKHWALRLWLYRHSTPACLCMLCLCCVLVVLLYWLLRLVPLASLLPSQAIPRDRRTYLYSATMTSKVVKLQKACLKNPIKVEVSSKYQTVKTLLQQVRHCAAAVFPFPASLAMAPFPLLLTFLHFLSMFSFLSSTRRCTSLTSSMSLLETPALCLCPPASWHSAWPQCCGALGLRPCRCMAKCRSPSGWGH